MRRGFSLVELLVVIGIIAILSALLFPAFIATRAAVKKTVAARSLGQVGLANSIYMSDNDDTYPPAIYVLPDGRWQCWFGRQDAETLAFSSEGSLLEPYTGGRIAEDPTHRVTEYIGDLSGFGYNYGHIGGDFYETGDWSQFPVCERPANSSHIDEPSQTVTFATTAFYYANWLEGGDGIKYDFGFFDPPHVWRGVPNVDFRHQGTEKVDRENKEYSQTGYAVFLFADGSIRAHSREQAEKLVYSRSIRIE